MRNFWQRDFPVGDPRAGAPYGQRNDPGALSTSSGSAGGLSQGAGIFGTLLGFIGNMGAASASENAARAQKQALDFEAAQLRVNAGQAIAASQRGAEDARLRAELMASRAVVAAAAGGSAATDPGVARIVSDITGRGAYNAAVALYQGEDAARTLRTGADTKAYEGEVALQGGKDRSSAFMTKGFGALGLGSTSLFAKYGRGGPKKTDPDQVNDDWAY